MKASSSPDGIALVVGCSHAGIEAIVAEAATINPRIRFVAGGFHLVVAQDSLIAKVVAALHETYNVERIAPGHCSGEYTFAAVNQIVGDTYQYAGVGAGQRRIALIGCVLLSGFGHRHYRRDRGSES